MKNQLTGEHDPHANFSCDRTCPFFERRDFCRFNPIFSALGNEGEVNSHVVTVNVKITDLDALRAAAEHCGLTFSKADTYTWYGRHVGDYPLPEGFKASDLGKCDYKLSRPDAPGAYEIGIVQREDGFVPIFDFYGHSGRQLQKHVGSRGEKLIDRYGLECAISAAAEQGWMVEDHGDHAVVHHPSGGTLEIREGGEIEANEFTGAGCHDASKVLIGAMGEEDDFSPKPEYFDTPAWESEM